MKKKLIISFSALALVLAAYSGLWFFQASWIKKHLRNLSTQNESTVSIDDVQVSGFPLRKKIRITNLKISNPKNGSLEFKELVVEAGIFETDFEMNVIGPITARNENGKGLIIEFNSGSKISVTTKQGKIAQTKWVSNGYKITSAQTNAVILNLSSQSSEVEIIFGENTIYRHQETGVKIGSDGENLFSLDSISFESDASKKSDQNQVRFDLTLKNIMPLGFMKILTPDDLSRGGTNFSISGEISSRENEEAKKIHAQQNNPTQSAFPKSLSLDVAFTLKNLELTKENYKISATGSINYSALENSFFGEVNATVENINNLLASLGQILGHTNPTDPTLTTAEIIKQLGNVNPASTEKITVFNIQKNQFAPKNEILFNDVSLEAISRTRMNLNAQSQLAQMELQMKQMRHPSALTKEIFENLKKRTPPPLDLSGVDTTTLNSTHVDLSKLDHSQGEEKIKQFYQILLTQKNGEKKPAPIF